MKLQIALIIGLYFEVLGLFLIVKIKLRKKSFKVRDWLTNNKIYFETLMTISLTIMSIILSVISLSFEKRAINIQEEELNYTKLSNMPVFNVSYIDHSEEYEIDGTWYEPSLEYIILNNGGEINVALLNVRSKIEIYLHDSNRDINASIAIEDLGRYLKDTSRYDAESKSFTILKDNDKRYDTLEVFLKKELENYYNCSVEIEMVDYIFIFFIDITGESQYKDYIFIGDGMSERGQNDTDKEMQFEIKSMTDEEIYGSIIESMDSVLQSK